MISQKSYFTVWFNSNKLRLNGHNLQLKYQPIFFGADRKSDGTVDSTCVLLSQEDIAAIYGYDINYWGEKNTFYLNRNGKGYLQTCTEANAPKVSTQAAQSTAKVSSNGSYATYPTSRHIPDFTAVTGISGQKDPSRVNYYTYYNVSQAARDKYFNALRAAGLTEISSDSTMVPTSGLILAKKAYIYGTPPNNVQSQLILGYTVEENGVLTVAFNPEYY